MAGIRPTSPRAAAESVRLAGERGWAVSVRSGGHSWAAWSLHDALLIDLAGLRDMAYDPASGVVSARPAVRGGLELAPFLAERGRAFPGGHCASVGLGGYLLQGGQGWDGRARGWACQSVAGLDVVTADGTLVRADASENSDLLWAARGAGPGFPGVVTLFRLQTHQAPQVMWHDTWTFRLDDTVELLTWLHDVLPELDRRVEPVVAATRLPDVPLFDGTARPDGTAMLLRTTVMADSDSSALTSLAPLRDGPLTSRSLGHVQAGPVPVRRRIPAAGRGPRRARPGRPVRVVPDLRPGGAERAWLRRPGWTTWGWRSPTWPRRPGGSARCSGWCPSSGSGSRRWT